MTGVTPGTATITCKQTYKNKTTVVGTCKVKVRKANLRPAIDLVTEGEASDPKVAVGDGVYDVLSFWSDAEAFYYIGYRNPSAKYIFTSDSNDFTMEEVKYYASKEMEEYVGKDYVYGYKYSAKKAGIYTITANEIYNKRTTKLGSFKVEVKDTYVEQNVIDLRLGDDIDAFSNVYYAKAATKYYFSIEGFDDSKPESNVVGLLNDDNGNIQIKSQIPGTAKITVHEGSKTGTVIGTMNINVYLAACTGIIVESELKSYVGDEGFYINFDLEPYDTTDKVTIESDKPDVLKVIYNEEEDSWSYTLLKAGIANVTIKCGDKTAVCKVTVVKEEEDLWD